ncbi:3-phosphoserine/phosphohydroxythreonine transaminase [Hutsoniella sourekii]|uniref:3-phosphoserine/phosphohydroxythreonine transaminase n=1 Tax=Hutsoniella sourekii TaxID=87650 RepID=UPI0004866D9B|nr:3-phosphoserine/phosphohydroxythreonine transaminase [Hutsoniella sourekii]
MNRIYNFSAGPSVLPVSVLEKAANELVNYQDQGLSVMEMSHRSAAYDEIHQEAIALLRKLMNIPDNYEVLFLTGGASTQFAMVPLNLMTKNHKADYLITGSWANKAYQQAKEYGDVRIVASSKDQNFTYIPKTTAADYRKEADYIHICTNNTIYGTRIKPDQVPQVDGVPLVADMSSNILSEEYDVNKFGLIYAGTQKNMAPAGLTVAIIRKDLIGPAQDKTPIMLQYKTHVDSNSLYNTPPTYNIYMLKLVLEWLEELGGIPAMEAINKEKAQKLYQYIDESPFYKGTARPEDRSLMNVPFLTPSPELDAKFIEGAKKRGLENLKGHRSVGGIRASIYNAMPIEGIDTLIDYMAQFAKDNK